MLLSALGVSRTVMPVGVSVLWENRGKGRAQLPSEKGWNDNGNALTGRLPIYVG